MRNCFFIFRFSRWSRFPALAAIFVTASGCLSRGTDEAGDFAPAPPALSQVDFATLKDTVLTPHCIQCHADFDGEAAVLNFVVPGNPSGSVLYTDIASGAMPPGGPPLPASSVWNVAAYIQGLEPPAAPPVPAAPDPSSHQIDYATLKAKVLQPLCIQCHADFATEAGLRPYVVAGDPDHSLLCEATANGSMPPGDSLKPELLELIRDYVTGLKGQ